MRYCHENNGTVSFNLKNLFGQKLAELDASIKETQVAEMVETMNAIDENYSETQIIEFLDNVGVGGDLGISDFLECMNMNSKKVEYIREAFKCDAETNGW